MVVVVGTAACVTAAAPQPTHDVVIRHGRLYDGSGKPGVLGDIAQKDGRIAAIGHIPGRGARKVDASGLAVTPGFINMLSRAGDVDRRRDEPHRFMAGLLRTWGIGL
jgi:N-acyl-D-amino-acid deacylase